MVSPGLGLKDYQQRAIRLGLAVLLACFIGYGVILPGEGTIAGTDLIYLLYMTHCTLRPWHCYRHSRQISQAILASLQVGGHHLRGALYYTV